MRTCGLPQTQRNDIAGAFRGRNQIDWASWLAAGHGICDPSRGLKGRAKQYSTSYSTSWKTVIERIQQRGLHIVRLPGPRGGMTSATHYIAEAVTDPEALAELLRQRGAVKDAVLLHVIAEVPLPRELVLSLLTHDDKSVREQGIQMMSRLKPGSTVPLHPELPER